MNKKIQIKMPLFYLLFFINYIFCVSHCFASQNSFYEEVFYRNLFKTSTKIQIVTANFKSYDPPDIEELKFTQNVSDRSYEEYESKEDFKGIDQEKMIKLGFLSKEILESLNKIKKHSSKENLSLVNLTNILKEAKQVEELLLSPLHKKIEENILLQENVALKRADSFFQYLDKIVSDENTLYIVVLHEAFFNYFNNPRGFGNFIPFKEESFKTLLKIAEEKTQKSKNLLFIPNFVYHDSFSNLSGYNKNFNIFAQHSFKQKKILGRYEKLLSNEKITPIKNESSVFWDGEITLKYQKQFILDEDIPDYFYQTSNYESNYIPLYVPGTPENGKVLRIEICQDHDSLSTKKDYNLDYNNFLIVQSASINLRDKILSDKKYTGIVIHADSNISNNKVIFYQNGEQKTIKQLFEKPVEIEGIFFNLWDISIFKDLFLKKK